MPLADKCFTPPPDIVQDAAWKGMAIWTAIGASACFMGHHLFPGFRRQTLALKGFITSGFTIFGLCVGADTVLLNHEASQRSEENYIRNRARTELGRQGIVASETEIMKWRDSFMRQREEQRAQQENKA